VTYPQIKRFFCPLSMRKDSLVEFFKKLVFSPAFFLALLFATTSTLTINYLALPMIQGAAIFEPNTANLIGIGFGALALFSFLGFFIFSVRRNLLTPEHFERLAQKSGPATLGSLVGLCLLFLVVVGVVCLACGGFAVLVNRVASPALGIQELKGIVALVVQVMTILVVPFLLLVLANLTFFGTGTTSSFARSLKRFRRALPSLVLGFIIVLGVGYLFWMLLGLIQNEPLSNAISFTITSFVGALLICGATAACANVLPSHKGLITGEEPNNRAPFLSPRTARTLNGATSFFLAFVLAASLVGTAPLAWAEEMLENASEADSETADETTPDPPVELTNPASTNLGIEIPEPNTIEAFLPINYYEQDTPLGIPIATDGDWVTYQTGEKSFSTVFGGVATTYVDEEGDLQLIDNTLEPVSSSEGAYFENAANSFSVLLPTTITDAQGIRIEKDEKGIEIIPQEGDFTRAMAAGSALRFTEVFPGIDYQYTLVGSVIKEDIVLNREVDQNRFTSKIILDKGFEITCENGAILVFETDEEEGEENEEGEKSKKTSTAQERKDPFISISAPVMIDAAGQVSDALELSLEQDDQGVYFMVLIADKGWLSAPERAYPLRIDPTTTVDSFAISLIGVEQGSGDMFIGDNGYPYSGYDDGITSGNYAFGIAHWMTRTYIYIDYNFAWLMSDAKINSATFSLHHFTSWSGGNTSFGLYQVDDAWDKNWITWNSQLNLGHTAIEFKNANPSPGYIDFDVREVVNNWAQNLYPQRGFVVKAQTERTMQCEVFSNNNSSNPPRLVVNWEIPDPVDESIPLDDLTINLRTITEKDISGKLLFDGVFADGVVTPRATINYWLAPDDDAGLTSASRSYIYPDSSAWADTFPRGTPYKDKLSNWQSKLFGGLDLDKAYRMYATASLGGVTSKEVESDKFLIYQVKGTVRNFVCEALI